MSIFAENTLAKDEIHRKPNDYLYAQRSLKHKVKIFYEEMQNLFIDNTKPGEYYNENKFNNNEFEELTIINSSNASNLKQLITEETYNKDITYENYFYLDGNAKFGEDGLKLLGRTYTGETENIVGWISDRTCNSAGYFEHPARLMHEFKSDQSIVKWLIRSISTEVAEDFSLCVYDKDKKMIFKEIVTGNKNSTYKIKINRGLCRYIELRITKWAIKDVNSPGELTHSAATAKIVYFYHDATFPKGTTEYKSNDLLQSFSINEFLCSSIGKANYGVQSNTGQFSLININKLFDTLKFAGYIKNGLKVQYFVCVDKYYSPKVDAFGDVDEKATVAIGVDPPVNLNAGSKTPPEEGSTVTQIPETSTALSLDADEGEWILLATHYITDIEYDEVKSVVRFKTQDRLIKFKDITYSGYKKIANNMLAQIRNCDLIHDIMNRAKLGISESKSENTWPGLVDNSAQYEITERAAEDLSKRTVPQGYLDEMSVWAALQKACDMDLIHTYINREDLLVIDKIDQL